jgi:2-amino-4-hydroxy-6-hydroxymethyldihydropteridine diphosphokinase
MEHIVYLALGTNLGDRLFNLRAAIDALAPTVRVLAESHIYETPPWGYVDQPLFLNMALKAETELSPHALLAHLKGIESRLGRAPTFRYGPRQIDIDILFYDDLILDEAGLVIPHPRLHERAFVLVPLADLASGLRHPLFQTTVAEMSGALDSSGIRRAEDT